MATTNSTFWRMGLCNAPATFQKLMYKVLGTLLWKVSMAYLDDIIIFSKSVDDHATHLDAVLSKLKQAGLKIKLPKCEFGKERLQYLGHVVDGRGVSPDPENLKAVYEFPVPKTPKEVMRFLGLAGYYRRFIESFSTISKPLSSLTPSGVPFQWTEECENAFQTLRARLCQAPILKHPEFNKPFYLYSDASAYGIGVILKQDDDNGSRKVVAYASRTLNQAEQNYSATERECLAIVFGTQKFRPYLFGTKFTVVTDHCALCWLMKVRNPNGRLARWSLCLQEFDYEIQYKSGKTHLDADALSRAPVDPPPDVEIEPALVLEEDDWVSVRSQQLKEPWLRLIIEYLEREDDAQRVKRSVTKAARCYEMKNKMCHRKILGTSGFKSVLVVPKEMRQDLMYSLHDEKSCGHLGLTKTWERIRERFFWPKMYPDVKNYVLSCQECGKQKTFHQKPVGLLQPLEPVSKPFQRVGLDKLGPFPESNNGNKHIFVCTDYATRTAIAAPSRLGTAEEAAKFFVSRVILEHGAPSELVTDRGREFVNDLFTMVTKLHSVKHNKTTSYHPKTNGQTERFQQNISRHDVSLCNRRPQELGSSTSPLGICIQFLCPRVNRIHTLLPAERIRARLDDRPSFRVRYPYR